MRSRTAATTSSEIWARASSPPRLISAMARSIPWKPSRFSLPELAAGEGREEVSSYCSTCHSTRYITMQAPLPPDVWTAEVNKMINMFGLELPEDAKPIVLKYLHTHYTPETRKR